MATEMIHLLVAREWARGRLLERSPEFYLGAISPDAVHARAGSTKADKQATHLGNHSKLDSASIAEYLRNYTTDFDIGYAVHLVTDPLWCEKYRRELPGLFDESGHTIPRVYYADCAASECELADMALIDAIEKAVPPSGHPLVIEREIRSWRDEVIKHYHELKKPDIVYGILTADFVRDFVREAAEKIETVLRRSGYESGTTGNNGSQEHEGV